MSKQNVPGGSAVDLGCGPNKTPGTIGVDHHAYAGVDIVVNLDEMPWPIEADRFSRVYVRHFIEHVADIKSFMREVHRIAVDGALVDIVTPHFSSIDSWKDPTHRWHLSSEWYTVFTESYLAEQVPQFEHVSSHVSFGKSLRSQIPRLMVRLKGYAWWEKNFAFVYPGRNLTTQLRVCK